MINSNGLDLPIWFLNIVLIGLFGPPPPAMDRVKWAQNCLNNQILIEDTYSQSFKLELFRLGWGGLGWGGV